MDKPYPIPLLERGARRRGVSISLHFPLERGAQRAGCIHLPPFPLARGAQRVG